MYQRPVPSQSAHLESAVECLRLGSDTEQHLEPTAERRQMGPAPMSHRVYENISADGHSRNVYGDIYNTYHVHSQDEAGAPEHPSVESRKAANDAAKTLMDALAFDQMDTRLATISTAHAQTCQWLFAREEYASWRNPETLHKHHGFFWIKGKPGAGKSTLMKCAYQYGGGTHKDFTMSFFFNARGECLQKSAEGMYRSLLYQLLKKMPGLAPALAECRGRSTQQSWHLAQLEDMLAKAVQALGSNAVTCYVDALDECDDEEARKMIEHFETLGKCAANAETEFRVLLSSRHYPHILLEGCLELHVEKQKEHEADIAEYIRCKLKIGKGRLALEIQDEIRKRACGVFLWVVLVIRILNEYDARGKTHLLKTRLAALPDGLSELFEEILQRETHDSDDTLLTFQLILFAQRPLERVELYFAVITNSTNDVIEEWDPEEITSDVMERFLLDSSKGLAEMTKGRRPTVQFIRESVRDFLLAKGLALIQPKLSEDLVPVSHEYLRDCCLQYLKNSQTVLLPHNSDGNKAHLLSTRPARRDKAAAAHPFLAYAIGGILYHANLAHATGRPQNEFVVRFPHGLWRRHFNIFCRVHHHLMRVETQSLYTFVAMEALELARVEIQNSSSHVENRLEGERYPTLLGATVDNGDRCMMDLLLRNGAVPNDSSWPPASSCLSLAIKKRDLAMVRTLVEWGAGPTCIVLGEPMFVESLHYALNESHCDQEVVAFLLTRAPYSLLTHWPEVLTETLFVSRHHGYHSIERLLLRRMHLLVDELASPKASVTVEDLDNLFVAACGYGNLSLVNNLIEHGILRASSKIDQAFDAASRNGYQDVVRILLERGVEVDMRLDGLGTTALIVASRKGHTNLVQLLLHYGAEVPRWCTALHSAARNGHVAIVKMLLDAGADPNTRCNHSKAYSRLHREYRTQWDTTLHLAVRCESAETVRMLLDHPGFDDNVLDADGDHAIITASMWGYVDCVQLLLEREIPLEHLNVAAKVAWTVHSAEIVDMLLAKGATPPKDYYERSSNVSSSPNE